MLGGAIAAAAGYLVIRPPLDMWPSIEELSADYRTGEGEQRKVMLAPDISVELNTQTSPGAAACAERNAGRIDLGRGLGGRPKVVVDAAGDAGTRRTHRCAAG